MKPSFKLPVYCLVCLVAIVCVTCDFDHPVMQFTGTITVPDVSYWAHVKMGIFSGGPAGTYPGIDHAENGMTLQQSRLIYTKNDDGSTLGLPQVAGAAYSISPAGTLTRTFSFTLPSTYPVNNEYYYVACFYDADDDGLLDVEDSSDPTQQLLGEYNRFTTTPSSNLAMPGDIGVFFFCRAYDGNSHPLDEYMFGNGYEMHGLLTSTSTGFNYNISADSGW